MHEETTARQATEDGRRQHEQRMKATFDAITTGRVTEASLKLIEVTEWLVGSVRALGKTLHFSIFEESAN